MKLIFVYNADSGPVNALFDIGHKILSPATYPCNLCQLTHGAFSEKKGWKKFRETSAVEMEFLHKDDFERDHGMQVEYPVVLRQDAALEVLLPKSTIDSLADVESLIAAIEEAVRPENPP